MNPATERLRRVIQNHRRAGIAVLAALSVPLLIPLVASSHPRGRGGPGGRGPTPMVRALEHNAERLGLDEATLEKIRERAEKRREEARPVLLAQREEGKVLRELLAQPTPDREAVMRQLEVVGQLRTNLRKQQMEAWLDIRSLLTPEQLNEFEQLRKEHHKAMGRRFRHREGADDGDRSAAGATSWLDALDG